MDWAIGRIRWPGRLRPGKVWATQPDDFGDMWWTSDGATTSGGVVTPADPDTIDGNAWPGPAAAAWYAGGSDGRFIYHVVVDKTTGQWFIDKFNADATTLLDRWEITGWSRDGDPYFVPFVDIQYVCASARRIVVIGEKYTGFDHIAFGVTVFDTSGTIINQWNIDTPAGEFGQRAALQAETGCCTDGSSVFFGLENVTGDFTMAKVDLSTGVLTELWTLENGSITGVIRKDRDLIYGGEFDDISGVYQLRRRKPDGTLVWSATISSGSDSLRYRAVAHSGRDSVYAGLESTALADEWSYDGVFVQTIDIPESTIHGWLAP